MSAVPPSLEQIQLQQAQKAEYEERRTVILDQVLEPAAKERLTRLSLVKKELVRAVEDSIITGATNGRLSGKVTDEQLIAMLEQVGGSAGGQEGSALGVGKKKVVIQRRKYAGVDEDDDDDDSDLL
eukprot:scaffold2028_cov181-Ochromonas_danica.AAC.19